jgi:hypothetical protein
MAIAMLSIDKSTFKIQRRQKLFLRKPCEANKFCPGLASPSFDAGNTQKCVLKKKKIFRFGISLLFTLIVIAGIQVLAIRGFP